MTTASITASTSTGAADAALQRRRVLTILLGALTIVGLSATDRRAIFMPWSNGEHPLVDTTPSAFFAQALPGGRGARGPGFSGAGRPPSRFVATTGGATPGGAVPPIGVDTDGVSQAFASAIDPAPSPLGGGGGGGSPAGSGPGLPSIGTAGAPIVTGSVPETSTWGMMILGFGLVGAAIRRARRRIAPGLA